MIIQENDYRLTPIDDSSLSFDLELSRVVNKGKNNERTEFQIAGYGLSLSNAIKRIAQYRVACNHKEEAISLLTYFNEFKKELESLNQFS